MTHAILGIDIAKRSFHVALCRADTERHQEFENTPRDHRRLLKWIRSHGVEHVHACLEATGPYGHAVATALYEAGHTVSILNPIAVHAFARSELSRSKTDKTDAALIARFCRAHDPLPWTPPTPAVRHLQGLIRRATSVLALRQQEARRLQSVPDDPMVRRSIRGLLRYLDRELLKLRGAIRAHLQATPELKQQHDLLTSIPGIGTLTAATLLAEIVDFDRYASARQVAAYAGVVPRIRQSGASVHSPGRMCKMGPSRLRHALYFPAMAALRVNPVLQQLQARLRERGKRPMVILGAAMRKLLHLAYGVLKSGRPFDPAMTIST